MPTPDSPSRAACWQWLQVALLVANLWWTTLCLGGYRPETMVITSGLTGLLLWVHFLGRIFAVPGTSQESLRNRARAHPAGWLLLPFLAYAAINAAWITPVPWLGWHDWLMWAQMIAVFWVVLNAVRSPAARMTVLGALFALGAVAVALACYQRLVKPDWLMLGRTQAPQFIGRASGPFGIPNSLAAFLLLILPATGVLACKRGAGIAWRLLFGGLTLMLAGGLVLTISRGAWLGLILALAAWPLLAKGRNWMWRLGGAVAVLGVLLAAVATLYFTAPLVKARLDALVRDAGENSRPIMWRGAWQIFREHPGLGGGAGSFNVLFEKHRPEYFQDEPQWAHNDYLNTLSDYGVVGFTLFFGAGLLIIGRSLRGTIRMAGAAERSLGMDAPGLSQALALGVLAFALQLFVDFHFKIPALAMIFATIAALLVQHAWPEVSPARPPSRLGRAGQGIVATALLLVMVFFVLPHYRAEAERYDTRRKIDKLAHEPVTPEAQKALFQAARDAFMRATALDPSNSQAWSDRAYVAELWSIQDKPRTAELGREAEAYARRALAGSKLVPEFWLRLGVSLDMQGQWVDAGDAFIEALRLANASSTTWFYQAYHLSLKPSMRALAVSAIATSLRLDPSRPEAEALRQRLEASH
jgi:tetratricopeptide (TPR) repeat protein